MRIFVWTAQNCRCMLKIYFKVYIAFLGDYEFVRGDSKSDMWFCLSVHFCLIYCWRLGDYWFFSWRYWKYPNFQLVIVKNLIFSCSEKDRSLGHIILFPPCLYRVVFWLVRPNKMANCQSKPHQKSSKCQSFLRAWHLVIFRASRSKEPPYILSPHSNSLGLLSFRINNPPAPHLHIEYHYWSQTNLNFLVSFWQWRNLKYDWRTDRMPGTMLLTLRLSIAH